MIEAMRGVVVKAQTNLYDVWVDGEVWRCALRGRLRRTADAVLTGDQVEVARREGSPVIERVLPRRNRLVRPPIANVDRVLLVQAVVDPDPVPILLDRILVQAEAAGLVAVICFNKVDLLATGEGADRPQIPGGPGQPTPPRAGADAGPLWPDGVAAGAMVSGAAAGDGPAEEPYGGLRDSEDHGETLGGPLPAHLAELVSGYRRAGYSVYLVSAVRGWGIPGLRRLLQTGVTVVAGPSGAGKSTLLNAVEPGLRLATGEVSRKLGRGRHTTRHVQLLPLRDGGWVADTPGFSRLDVPEVEPEELASLWPDLERYAHGCRFRGCLHRNEPGCAVRQALDAGHVAAWRYQNYLTLLAELEARWAQRYR